MDTALLSTLGLGAGVLSFISGLGLFATKQEVSALEARVATLYVLKSDLDKRLERLENQLQLLNSKLDKLTDDLHQLH